MHEPFNFGLLIQSYYFNFNLESRHYILNRITTIITLITLFILLNYTIYIDASNIFDNNVLYLVNDIINTFNLNNFLQLLSNISPPVVSFIFILSILAILFFINKRQFWVYGFWSFFVLLTGTILKFTVERPRPVASVDGFSFPSMHVLTFAVLIVLINYIKTNKLIKTISCLLIISMMASRIYLHAHFFSDTLASILIILIFSQILTLYDKQKVFFYENEK